MRSSLKGQPDEEGIETQRCQRAHNIKNMLSLKGQPDEEGIETRLRRIYAPEKALIQRV